jgi:cobalt-zinc-cadmium efflux system membrane fusion protein
VDALSKLRLDRANLEQLREAAEKGAVPERAVREAERTVEADDVAVARVERTLRSWRLTADEVQAVREEAERLRDRRRRPAGGAEDWAKVEVRAPFAGTVVERNLAVGDLVDTTTDLFKVADMHQLAVWVHAYEEDLPALTEVPPEQLRWAVRLKADPEPLHGRVEHVSDLIDPNQHTVLVTGRVENPRGKLRANQFVTARVELPPPADEVTVPLTALVEDGRSSVIIVQEDPSRPEYTLRPVAVARRLPDAVCLRSRLTPADERRGAKPVRPGERVVASGAVELKAALEDLRAGEKSGE